jgi:uncharacterized repeat protein (TIGR03987 family)
MFVIAVSFIFSALALYTVGVWAERISGKLKPWHAVLFWCGLACDTVGTGAMGKLAGNMFQVNFHGITGLIAIVLMLFHATWAVIVLARRNERLIATFHRLSVLVWAIWLVPMIGGMVFGSAS